MVILRGEGKREGKGKGVTKGRGRVAVVSYEFWY